MTKQDDISSTEKLLDAIRNKTSDIEIEEEKVELPTSNISGSDTVPVDEDLIEVNVFNQGKKNEPSPPKTKSIPNNLQSTTTSFIADKKIKSVPKAGSRASMVVGVKLNHNDVSLVMVNRISAANRELLKYKKIPFPSNITRESKEFSGFLKSSLVSFCGSYANCEIWAAVPSDSLENRYFTIPKVPDKKIANAAYWTFRKEVPFEEGDMIFDFEVIGETVEDNARKLTISAYIVDKFVVNEIKKLYSEIKFPLFGISVAPFAFQNFFRLKWVEPEVEKICTVNIGLEHSRIDIFSKGDLVMSRNVKTGIDSMIGAIREESEGIIKFDGIVETDEEEEDGPVLEIETFDGDQPEIEIDHSNKVEQSIGSQESTIPISAGSVLDIIINQDYNNARDAFLDITNKREQLTISAKEQKVDDHIFEMINPVVERLVRQIERTFEYFSRTYKTGSPTKVIFTGELATYKRLTEYIGAQLGLSIGLIDPFASSLQLTQTIPFPNSIHERESFSMPYGLAISDISHTPNLIYTYTQKQLQKRVKLVNISLFSTFAIALLVCIGILFNSIQARGGKKAEINEIKSSLSRFSPLVDQTILQKLYQDLQKKKGVMKKYAVNCLGTAVISELTTKTPDTIKLVKVEADLYSPVDKIDGKDSAKNKKKQLKLEGYVADNPMSLESTLAGYLVDINSSPIFGKVTIKKKNIIVMDENEVLSFQAIVEMI